MRGNAGFPARTQAGSPARRRPAPYRRSWRVSGCGPTRSPGRGACLRPGGEPSVAAHASGRAGLGDAIRRPTAWCEMPGCISHHDHPAALGEADIRARALAAGWCHDAVGRLVCPTCQQRNPDLWIAHRLARQARAPARGSRQDTTHARAGRLSDVLTAVSARARAFTGSQDRRPRWPHVLAALAGADNGWSAPPRVPARSVAGGRHRTGPAVSSRPAGRRAAVVAPATRGGGDHRRNLGQ